MAQTHRIIGVGSPAADAPDSLDLASAVCKNKNCPVYLRGERLTSLIASAEASETDVLCYFGTDIQCAGVLSIRADELTCNSPVLPPTYTIAPFGVLVLQPGRVGPGVLFLPTGIELNFFDSSLAPIINRVEPPYSDILNVPSAFTVYGYNLGPGKTGFNMLLCKWNNEAAVAGVFRSGDQTRDTRWHRWTANANSHTHSGLPQ